LADGIGNLVARVQKLAEIFNLQFSISNKFSNPDFQKIINKTQKNYRKALDEFKFNETLKSIWELISFCDKYIEEKKPWQSKDKKVISDLLVVLDNIAGLLEPFLPETSEKIKKRTTKPLFPRC